MAAIMSLMGCADVFTSEALQDAYGSLLVSVLTGAELSVWMGSGRKAVERVWEVRDQDHLHSPQGLKLISFLRWRSLPSVLLGSLLILNGTDGLRSFSLEFLRTSVGIRRGKLRN